MAKYRVELPGAKYRYIHAGSVLRTDGTLIFLDDDMREVAGFAPGEWHNFARSPTVQDIIDRHITE